MLSLEGDIRDLVMVALWSNIYVDKSYIYSVFLMQEVLFVSPIQR
jgi:hypothetical protein